MTDPEPETRTEAASDAGEAALSDVEREALKDLVAERRAARRRGASAADGERDVLAKIAEMAEPDRSMAERIHALVREVAPDLVPRTFYGMPAYAKDGQVICFFQAASKFKVRYATFGFQPAAKLDDGPMWPVAYALLELTPEVEERIRVLVRKAAG